MKPKEKARIAGEIERLLGADFIVAPLVRDGIAIATHRATGLELVYAPGGAAVKPLLVSRYPLSREFVEGRVELPGKVSRELIHRPQGDRRPVDASKVSVLLSWTEIQEILLGLPLFRLPTEAEWEHFHRAGTSTQFFFGDELPDDEQLERLLGIDFAKPGLIPNPWGLFGMFLRQWTGDEFVDDDGKVDGRVIKGGASNRWPWQLDDEWVYALPTARRSSNDLFQGVAAVRLVMELP